jgi:type IV pilus assembly protein PilV
MLEILVTMVIVLLGLLGLAGVIARSSTAEMESYQRVQALILVQDMVDRINANRKYATCYSDGSTGRTLGTGYVGGTPTCTAGTSALEQAQAVADLTAWNTALLGSAEATGGTKFGAMIDARGCITQVDAANNIYRVSVTWQGLVATTASLNDTCGQNSYGTEAQRRVVNVTLRIGKLS